MTAIYRKQDENEQECLRTEKVPDFCSLYENVNLLKGRMNFNRKI